MYKRQFIDFILDKDSKANVIYVDFFDLKYDELKNYKALHDHIEGLHKPCLLYTSRCV